MASTTLRVLESDPRNSQHTRAVKRTERSSSKRISATDSSMNRVESKLTWRSIPSGRVSWILVSASRTPAATATALLPLCFRTPSPWAGAPLKRATRRTSSKPSSTSATSSR